jgi:hypothetical protein
MGAEQAATRCEPSAAQGDLGMVISFDSDADCWRSLPVTLRSWIAPFAGAHRGSMQGAMGATRGHGFLRRFTSPARTACRRRAQGARDPTDAQDEGSRLQLKMQMEAAQRTDTVHILLIPLAGMKRQEA